jgi:hypothetical protein
LRIEMCSRFLLLKSFLHPAMPGKDHSLIASKTSQTMGDPCHGGNWPGNAVAKDWPCGLRRQNAPPTTPP